MARGSWERLGKRLEYDLLHMLAFSVYLIQNGFIFFSFFSLSLSACFFFLVLFFVFLRLCSAAADPVSPLRALPSPFSSMVLLLLLQTAAWSNFSPVRLPGSVRECFTSPTWLMSWIGLFLESRKQLANNNLGDDTIADYFGQERDGPIESENSHPYYKGIEPAPSLNDHQPEIGPNELPRELPASTKKQKKTRRRTWGVTRFTTFERRSFYYRMDSLLNNRTKQLISWSQTDKVTFNWLSRPTVLLALFFLNYKENGLLQHKQSSSS